MKMIIKNKICTALRFYLYNVQQSSTSMFLYEAHIRIRIKISYQYMISVFTAILHFSTPKVYNYIILIYKYRTRALAYNMSVFMYYL